MISLSKHSAYIYFRNLFVLKNCILILYLQLFSPFCLAENQTERILNFNDKIVVHEDASIDVTEEISVYANDNKIIHGIRRQLPTSYTGSNGVHHQTPYQIRQILVNGKESSYHTVTTNNQFNIYIGDKNLVLKPGIYRYTIGYHINNAVNFLQNNDEIYWNITGNYWDFAIDNAQAYIQLPQPASISSYAGYTGAFGEQNKNFKVNQAANNEIEFTTTTALAPGQGLTVAVAWQKGIIHQPTFWQQFNNEIRTNIGQLIVFGIFILTFGYYLLAWNYHGRDPHPDTIIPLFDVPDNIPPADMRYLINMDFDQKILSAAIVSMAVKGYLQIKNTDDEFSLTKIQQNNAVLSDSEKAVAAALFKSGNTIKLTNDNHEAITKSATDLGVTLKNLYENRYFITNKIYLIPGIILTILAFAIACFAFRRNSDLVMALLLISAWSIGVFILFKKAVTATQSAMEYASFSTVFAAIWALIVAIVFLGIEILMMMGVGDPAVFYIIPLLFITIMLNVAFYYLLKRPTKDGLKLRDKIFGFKMFLGTTERYRLDQFTQPKKTPALFEKFLPYAIALNVGNQWASQFVDVLAQASEEDKAYQPSWYVGPNFSSRTIASFPSFLDTSLNDAVNTSSSSGGSSGIGFSGGGGGGGGW